MDQAPLLFFHFLVALVLHDRHHDIHREMDHIFDEMVVETGHPTV
jgi:hypothetical protein